MTYPQHRLALAIALITLGSQAHAASTTISTTNSTSQVLAGTDHLTVTSTGVLTNTGKAVSLKDATSGAGVVVDNYGQILSSGGRAFDSSGNLTSARNYIINNYAGALIQSTNDAFRIDSNFAGGSVTINNNGTLRSIAGGQGLDLDALRDGGVAITVNNYSGG